MQNSDGEPAVVRSFQGASDVRLTAATLIRCRDQVATGTQDGNLLLWNLAPGRPRPQRLAGQSGSITCIKASGSGKTLVSASTDSTVAIWKMPVEKRQTPAMLKLHFSPVRCCDISTDERLLLTASDDKSVKLTWLAERRFAAAFAGHSNWVRSASLSSSSTHMVSGGDDKTVKLWDVEQKSCLQTFSDSASSITCTRFGLGDHVIIASSWDSSINLWDVRSYGIRQHYGRAHGGSPITQVAVHPRSDLILSSSSDRQLRVWDLRAGKLCCTVLGHERPVHSCGFDEAGDHFLSCDSEMVLYWSCPPLAAPCPPAQPEPTPSSLEADALNLPSSAPRIDGPVSEGRSAEASDPLLAGEAARSTQAEVPRSRKAPKEALPEVVARTVEKMVTDMDTLTATLAALEARMTRTEAITAEVVQLLRAQPETTLEVPAAQSEKAAVPSGNNRRCEKMFRKVRQIPQNPTPTADASLHHVHGQGPPQGFECIQVFSIIPAEGGTMYQRRGHPDADSKLPNVANEDFSRIGKEQGMWRIEGLKLGQGELARQVQGEGGEGAQEGEGRAAVAYDLNRLLVESWMQRAGQKYRTPLVMVAMLLGCEIMINGAWMFFAPGDQRPFAKNAAEDHTRHLRGLVVRRDRGILSPTVFPMLLFPLLFVQQSRGYIIDQRRVTLQNPPLLPSLLCIGGDTTALQKGGKHGEGDAALVCDVYRRVNMASLLQATDYEVHELLVEKALDQGMLNALAKAVLLNGMQKYGISRRRLDYVLDLIQSCKAAELTELKGFLDSTGDYNSLYKLVYVDIKDSSARDQVLSHIHTQSCIARRQAGGAVGIKVLSDIDDTLLCSGGKFPAGCDDRCLGCNSSVALNGCS
ncbi:POC1A [Symbiodinium microadriaticum]|nr:POC1A [Symbiodinium microadriaticum]